MRPPFQLSDRKGYYQASRAVSADEILAMAQTLIRRRFSRGKALTDPAAVRSFLMLKLARLEHELFCCLYLDNQHRLIAFEPLFRGTIHSASIYPREVVKRTLALNASALIFAHNHPSGCVTPSEADQKITRQLKQALGLVDVRVLDHFIIGGGETFSFAEAGWL